MDNHKKIMIVLYIGYILLLIIGLWMWGADRLVKDVILTPLGVVMLMRMGIDFLSAMVSKIGNKSNK